jgi:ATP-binding cassette subfamily B protein
MLGKENATDEVKSYYKRCSSDNIINTNKQYETVLGENRLFWRSKTAVSTETIIKNAPILLFDDCLSAVDTQTEETILNNYKEICKNIKKQPLLPRFIS